MTNPTITRRALLLATSAALLVATGCGGGNSSSSAPARRGDLVGHRGIGTVSGVVLYDIDYRTLDVSGAIVTASGLVAVPQGVTGPRPMLCYFHGTSTLRTDAPSNPSSLEGSAVAQIFGGAGYVVVAPDYPGLGDDGTGRQSFEQAGPLAIMGVDMLRAARALTETLAVALSAKLFLAGFSQGGYAAMAVHRAIESEYASEFTVTASTPISGPYDLSGTTLQAALNQPGPETPATVAALLVAYNPVYHLFSAPTDVFAAPYAARIPGLFDGTHALGEIASALPATVTALLTPTFLATLTDPKSPLVTALRSNDVDSWKNTAPVRLYHSPTDEEVPYANAVVAQARISARGGDIQIVPVARDANHGTTPALAVGPILAYFNGLI